MKKHANQSLSKQEQIKQLISYIDNQESKLANPDWFKNHSNEAHARFVMRQGINEMEAELEGLQKEILP